MVPTTAVAKRKLCWTSSASGIGVKRSEIHIVQAIAESLLERAPGGPDPRCLRIGRGWIVGRANCNERQRDCRPHRGHRVIAVATGAPDSGEIAGRRDLGFDQRRHGELAAPAPANMKMGG